MKTAENRPKILFMGTPQFAVVSLGHILRKGYDVPCVVTAPDKPAGRGRKMSFSAVKKFALDNDLPLLQPKNLKDSDFISEVRKHQPDIIVVVAFRMLPKEVWRIPPLGTINLHASLLPQYRGAAPINHAIMNGEKKTGLTTFYIDEKIDTGKIIMQHEMDIGDDETAGELHERMLLPGAELVVRTIALISSGIVKPVPQSNTLSGSLKTAPRLHKDDTIIDWSRPARDIQNQIRGLSPVPAATTTLIHPDKGQISLRIFRAAFSPEANDIDYPEIHTDRKKFMHILLPDGRLELLDVQLSDRKRMAIDDFLRGFSLDLGWRIK